MPDFDQLLVRLKKEAVAKPQPVQAMMELTYGCNLRCVHCYNPTHIAKNELSTEQVFRILDQLQAQGTLSIGFTGGEIFTRRDAFEIFHYAKSRGFIITLLTNATMITPELADQVKDLDPYKLDISIYGATAETYEKVTQIPGSFIRFRRGVDLLIEKKILILLKLIMMTVNVHELPQMKEFARARNLRYKISTGIFPRVDGSQEPLAYRLSPEKAFEIWQENSGERILENRKKAPAPSPRSSDEDACGSAGRLFDCACGKCNAAITPYGKMNLCLSMYTPEFDLTRGTVAEGWENLVEIVASAKPGPEYECLECDLVKHCHRGTNHGWLQQGKLDGPCISHFKEGAQLTVQWLEENFLKGDHTR